MKLKKLRKVFCNRLKKFYKSRGKENYYKKIPLKKNKARSSQKMQEIKSFKTKIKTL
jgi:hypothetical protein